MATLFRMAQHVLPALRATPYAHWKTLKTYTTPGDITFCVLLKGCTEPEAAHFAERVVQEAGRQSVRLSDGRTVNFTLSAGYACKKSEKIADYSNVKLNDVIEMADKALYQAKNGGRNQAVAASALAPSMAVAA